MDDPTQQNNNTSQGTSNAQQTVNDPLMSFAKAQSVNDQPKASDSQISASTNTNPALSTPSQTPTVSKPISEPALAQLANSDPTPAVAVPKPTDQSNLTQNRPTNDTSSPPAPFNTHNNWEPANPEPTVQPSSSQQPEEKLLAIGEAARYLNVSIDTIRRWDSKGILHAVRSEGNLRRFSKAELDRCKAEQQKEDNMLTVSEAADLLKVSIQTMRRWDKSGKLRAQRDNQGQRLYPKAEIEEMIRTGSIPFMQESEDSADNNKQENRPTTPNSTFSPVNTPGVYGGKPQTAHTSVAQPTPPVREERPASISHTSAEPARPTPAPSYKPEPTVEPPKVEDKFTVQSRPEPSTAQAPKQVDNLDFEDIEELEEPDRQTEPKQEKSHNRPAEHHREHQSHHDHPYAPKEHEHHNHDKPDRRYAETQHEHKHDHPEASHHTVRSRKYVARIKTREPLITPAEYNSYGEFLKPQITDHGVDSTGTSVLPAGETKVVVKTQFVSNRSHIFVTPVTPTEVPLSVPVAISSEGFAVVTVKPQPYDIIFTWFIVDTHLED